MPGKNFYFIDEAGDLNDQSKIFLIGCIITDTPELLLKDIESVEQEIRNSGYFYRFRNAFSKTGFHASTNHPDIYARFATRLPTMNFRAYAVILNKQTEYFARLVRSQPKEQIYNYLAKQLLQDRLAKRAEDANDLFFEQNLPSPTPHKVRKRESELEALIAAISDELLERRLIRSKLKYHVSVQNKKAQKIFAVVDYVNHIIMKVYEGRKGKVDTSMKENFRLIEPKIGCIHDVSKKAFHMPRRKAIDVDKEFVD